MRKAISAALCAALVSGTVEPALAAAVSRVQVHVPVRSTLAILPGAPSALGLPSLTLQPLAAPALGLSPILTPSVAPTPQAAAAAKMEVLQVGVQGALEAAGPVGQASDWQSQGLGQKLEALVTEEESYALGDKELLQLREKVDHDIAKILVNDVGGALERPDVERHLKAVMKRLQAANGVDKDAVALHVGASVIPNAFTQITASEVEYLKKKGRLSAVFKNTNVFLSRGLVEAFMGQPDANLAFVLAHELAHNRLGHLKSLAATSVMMGHLQEFEADTEALKMIARAGYDPRQALGSLEFIEASVEGLRQKYAIMAKQNSEYHQLLSRLRDLHPNHNMRRANLEDHLSEALELYEASALKDKGGKALERVAKEVAKAPIKDSFVLFEEEAQGVVAAPKPFYEKVVALEGLLTRRIYMAQKSLPGRGAPVSVAQLRMEDQLIIENAIRALVETALDLGDLSNVSQMSERIMAAYPAINFPTQRSQDRILRRQVAFGRKILGPTAAARAVGQLSGKLSLKALQVLFNIYLKRVSTEAEWADALEFLGNNASALGYFPGGTNAQMGSVLARNLLAKTMALAVEQALPPDEKLAAAIAYLRAKVPATIIVTGTTSPVFAPHYLSTHLKAQMLDLYLTGKMGASPRLKAPDMALLLEGKAPRTTGEEELASLLSAGVMKAWNNKYFREQGADLSSSGRFVFNYERLDTKDVVLPSAEDLLEMLTLYPYVAGKASDEEENHTGMPLPQALPETLAAVLLKKTPAEQEAFWEQAANWALAGYGRRKHHAGSKEILRNRMAKLALLQESVVKHSDSLAPMTAVLAGVGRALTSFVAEPGEDSRLAASVVADELLRIVVNEHVAQQLKRARDSKSGIAPLELATLTAQVLALDASYASFNTTDRLRSLAAVFHQAVLDKKDLLPLVAYMRGVTEWKRDKDGGGSGRGVDGGRFSKENEKLFAAAGEAKAFDRLPKNIGGTLTSGALGLLADPKTTPAELLGASMAVYFNAQASQARWFDGKPVDQSLAFLLLEEAARRVRTPQQAKDAAWFLVRAHDLDALYLSYVPRPDIDLAHGLRTGRLRDMIRTEVVGTLAAGKQPFRERDASAVRALLTAIEEQGGLPEGTGDRLVLWDWAGRTGDYDSWVEEKILEAARQDPEGFKAWQSRDKRWTESMRIPERKGDFYSTVLYQAVAAVEARLGLPSGTIKLPELVPASLRLVRNPVRRAELYLAVRAGSPLKETASHHWLKELGGVWRLFKAYRQARKYFEKAFLISIVREASPDARIVMVLEGLSRVAEQKTKEAKVLWEAGKRAPQDKEVLRSSWFALSESEKQDKLKEYQDKVFSDGMKALMDLHDKYAAFLDPELGFLIDNFPEPSRSRDDLLERLARARKLTPERLSVIESYKSYRLPNPLRFVEKQFLEAASVQLAKLSASERVDLILHLAGAKALSQDQLAGLETKMIDGDQQVFMAKNLGIYSLRQYLRYVDQLHAEDKKLFVKSMFYGKGSISEAPQELTRLFKSLVIDGRGLPSLVEKILLDYFEIITPSERVRAITGLMGAARGEQAMAGPQVVKLALGNFGITGAKVGQVLATHKGLLPKEYAQALEGFKDSAQSVEKWRVLSMLEDRLARKPGLERAERQAEEGRRKVLAATAAHLFPEASEADLARYVSEVLVLERIKENGGLVTEIRSLGRELGSGSVKQAYKVTLKDGTTWVAKVRRVGATVDFQREFQIVEALSARLSSDASLRLPNVDQLLQEVKSLVLAELDFKGEAAKMARTQKNVKSRSALENLMKASGQVLVPGNHPGYLDDDIVLDEFFPSFQFKQLPERGFWRVTKSRLARAIVDEASQALILDEYIDPDRHTGNILQKSWFGLPWPLRPVKAVWIDLGQSVEIKLATVKPILRAGLELKYGRAEASAKALSEIFALAPGQSREELEKLLAPELAVKRADLMETMMAAIMRAEKERYLVRDDYAALEKAMLLLNGYAQYLPANYLMKSMEKAVFLRVLRERPRSAWRLAWHRVCEWFGADRRAQFLAEIENLGR